MIPLKLAPREEAGMALLRRRLFVRGSLLLCLLLSATDVGVASDPVTVGVGLGVAQSIQLLGNNGPDLNLQATLSSIEMLRAVHQRLDSIEFGIQTTLTLLKDLPAEIQRSLDRDRDITRSETLISRRTTLERLLIELQAAEKSASKMTIRKVRSDIHNLRLGLENEVNSLFEGSGFVTPHLTAAMVIEIVAARAEETPSADISRRLGIYDDHFAEFEQLDRQGSLAYLRDAMEKGQAEAEKKIAKEVTRSEGTIVAGDYDWYAYVQMANREEKEFVPLTCLRSRSQEAYAECQFNNKQEIMVTRPYAKEFHVWKRRVTKTPLDFSAGLYELKVEAIGGEAQPGDRPGTKQVWNAGVEMQKSIEDNAELAKDVQIYNQRAKAIQVLREFEGTVSMARVLAANWDPTLARELLAESKRAQQREVVAEKNLRQFEQEIALNRALAVMD